MQDLISGLMERKPARRLGMQREGIEGIKRHPWFEVIVLTCREAAQDRGGVNPARVLTNVRRGCFLL